MAGNENLGKAKQQKKDEFYTQLSDIERELHHYRAFFKDKTVLCNCDDPYESNFFKYFAMNFNALGLKKLIATCYATSPVSYTQLNLFGDNIDLPSEPSKKKSYRIEITEVVDANGDGAIDLADVEYLLKNEKNALTSLQGDGDFRSDECIEFLKEADVVVTNPPFSLFKEFVAQLMSYDKKFIIIGHQNAIHYKEIFPLIQNNKLWLGYGFPGNVAFFESPYEDRAVSSQHKEGMIRVSGVLWYTNIDIEKRHEKMVLFRSYIPDEYPKYKNYDAIEVGKTSDIPCDYYDIMGVPTTFLSKYNPEQFEIIGLSSDVATPIKMCIGVDDTYQQGGNEFYLKDGEHHYRRLYSRIAIRRKPE